MEHVRGRRRAKTRATAAVLQRREDLDQKRVGAIVCGANVSPTAFAACLQRGSPGVV